MADLFIRFYARSRFWRANVGLRVYIRRAGAGLQCRDPVSKVERDTYEFAKNGCMEGYESGKKVELDSVKT